MGGPVKIAVRLPDGKQMANELYTSSISAFFDNDRFIECDLFHIRKFMIDLADDDRAFVPSGYGLVVGDHINRKIYTMQCYTSLFCISETSMSLCLGGNVRTDEDDKDDYLDSMRFKRLVNKGYISTVHVSNWAKSYKENSGTLTETVDEIFNRLQRGRNAKEIGRYHVTYPITPDGWEVIQYNGTSYGYAQFLLDLVQAGFVFSCNEYDAWAEEIEKIRGYEKEDGKDVDTEPYNIRNNA